MARPIHVLGIPGSLRRGSYNRALLRAAGEMLPDGMTLEVFDLLPIPLYNGDVEAEGMPEPVRQFRTRIAAADALLIATPEYNYSMPGVLKNAIDWASRAPDPPLDGKPVALMGASMGMMGTARSQAHLRLTCVNVNLLPMNRPEVFVAKAQDKIDASGKLTDEPTRAIVRKLLDGLVVWTRRLSGE
jgi:chromate reductase